jgi:hypothetical protein
MFATRSGRDARLCVLGLFAAFTPHALRAQELVPAAYTPAPYGVQLVSFASFYSSGTLNFEPAAPIEDASARISSNALTYARTFDFAGRSANLTVGLPFIIGDVEGKYLGEPAEAHRNGFGDAALRFGVNLVGAPAMSRQEFAAWDASTMIGASLSLRAPTGQYERDQLINIGTNRWAFKPEIGLVQPIGRVAVDVYVGGWFYSTNPDFFSGHVRSQRPILSTELHLRYQIQPSTWFSLDANFWRGGKTTVDGVTNDDVQRESRVGGTFVIGLARGHTLRLAGSLGAVTRIGGDFTSLGFAYVYSGF